MMRPSTQNRKQAFTLLELVLVVGILVIVSSIAIPAMLMQLEGDRLPRSARQLGSLLVLVSSNAAFDGVRYRMRFPEEGADDEDRDALGGIQQPIIEREFDPIRNPDEFYVVTEPWAVGKTLLGDVWCAEVRIGRPSAEKLQRRRSRVEEAVDKEAEDFEPERLPLYFEPDATSRWATFVLTEAPRDTGVEDLEDVERVELIFEGATGLSWLQRPLYEEELDLFEEKGWPVVLRQDFLTPRVLTEDDVLELRDSQIPQREVAPSDVPTEP